MSSGHYVTARIDGGTANERSIRLCGPFTGRRGATAALRMVPAIEYIARRDNPDRYRFAAFGVHKLSADPLPPGRIAIIADAIFINLIINASRKI